LWIGKGRDKKEAVSILEWSLSMIELKDIVLEVEKPRRGLGKVIAMAGDAVQVVFRGMPPVWVPRDRLTKRPWFSGESQQER